VYGGDGGRRFNLRQSGLNMTLIAGGRGMMSGLCVYALKRGGGGEEAFSTTKDGGPLGANSKTMIFNVPGQKSENNQSLGHTTKGLTLASSSALCKEGSRLVDH